MPLLPSQFVPSRALASHSQQSTLAVLKVAVLGIVFRSPLVRLPLFEIVEVDRGLKLLVMGQLA